MTIKQSFPALLVALGVIASSAVQAAGASSASATEQAAASTTPTPVEDPQKVVIETADKVLALVNARRAELQADPKLVYKLVETSVAPHFDFLGMVRSAMGRYWRQATPSQQQELYKQFQEMLIRAYALQLLNFSSRQIEYPPMHTGDEPGRATVPTKVKPDGRPPVPLDYHLKLEHGKWLVYDVKIEGLSLLTQYRSSFARLIRMGQGDTGTEEQRVSKGIDSLIETIRQKNARTSQ